MPANHKNAGLWLNFEAARGLRLAPLALALLAMALLGPLRVADAYRPLQVLDAHTGTPAATLIITNAETLAAQVAPGEAIEF